jgi:hypothetical protein
VNSQVCKTRGHVCRTRGQGRSAGYCLTNPSRATFGKWISGRRARSLTPTLVVAVQSNCAVDVSAGDLFFGEMTRLSGARIESGVGG